MIIITTQYHVSIPIVMEKIAKEREHRIAINMLTPMVGVCVDGHHSYVASMHTHRPLRIVTAGNSLSGNNTGAGMLDYWCDLCDAAHETRKEKGTWNFYDLMTGKAVPVATLKKWVDMYPDYLHPVG